ncbi:MAG TPA: RNA polymerase sigma factor [Candidatus Polarisedimenticolaceae bacterium]|nr:RNA polymerase sigma factor [Candidatus Polarisedimenticolaceae bacterium]
MELFEPTDDELIAAIRSGSDLAFDRLMRRYRRLVYRVAYGYVGDPDDALDVVQETFLKVYSRLSSFRGEGTLKSWIVRIAANEAMNRKRSSARLETTELDESSGYARHPGERLVAGRALTRSLAALGAKHRLAIVLRYYGERSTREIAAALECSEGTARNVLFRGLAKLRTLMNASEESLR